MPKRTKLLLIFLPFALLAVWFVFNASRVGPLEGCLSGCSIPNIDQGTAIRFVSLNMLHEFPYFRYLSARVDLIVDELMRLRVDFVCLQEVPWTLASGSISYIFAEKLGMNYVYLPANGNRKTIIFSEGETILSKYPIEDVQYKELPPRAGFFEHRVALSARILVPDHEIRLICTHLTNGASEINLGQVRSLAEFTDKFVEQTVIVAGDFNATENLPQIQFLQNKWTDVYRMTHPHDPGHTCCVDEIGIPVEMLEERIDYIFIAQGYHSRFRVINSKVILDSPYQSGPGWLWASDHAGLYAEFGLVR